MATSPFEEGEQHIHPLRYAHSTRRDEEQLMQEVEQDQEDDDEVMRDEGDEENIPFYSHQNNSYYSNHHHHHPSSHRRNQDNLSEASLPLYRSRSQSLSAMAGGGREEEQEKVPALPEQSAAPYTTTQGRNNASHPSSTALPTVRAVDYTNTSSYYESYPPGAAPAPRTRSNESSNESNGNANGNTSTWSSNANTLTNSTSTNAAHHHQGGYTPTAASDKKRIDWAQDVAKVFDSESGTTKSFGPTTKKQLQFQDQNNTDSNTSPNLDGRDGAISSQAMRPSLSRVSTENDMDEDQNAFDDYDWDDDDELVKQLDEKYEEEYKKAHATSDGRPQRRSAVVRRFSPVHLGKLLLFTFLGNLIIVLILITPALVLQLTVKKGTHEGDHLRYVCDNVQAWCYWIAFNFIAKWIIHGLFDLIPKLFVFIVELIWGDLNEKFIGYVEMFNANAPYVKPLFFAGFFWGSFAVTFNSIFHLRDASDPPNSRAAYTYRVYQVVQLLFFIALVWSIEKILIRIISLNFHAVAYADRLSNNGFALSTIDKLKNYRPKISSRKRNGIYSGFNTPNASRAAFGDAAGGGGYFASPQMRSRANTPPFGNGNGNNNAILSPPVPGAPEPTHHSLWSRLPIPHSFRGGAGVHDHQQSHSAHSHQGNNAIPLQVSPQHFIPERRAPPTPVGGGGDATQRNRGNSVPGSAETSVPGTPNTPNGLNSSSNGKNKKKQTNNKHKKLHLFGKKAATAQEIARQAMVDPLKTLNNPDIVGKGLGLDFGGAGDAKKLARDFFYAFRADPSRNYLITSDFYPAFKSEHEAEAAFAVFDKDGNGDLSRPEIRATILAAYKERKFLARSLQDVSEAVSTLDRLFQVASLIILALIAFAIFNVDIYSNLTTAYTIAIAASFIFKSAAQNVFDSVIFLFATHPFDSGDRIFLETEVYVVKRLGLFSTLFTKWDGTETMIANSKLGQLPITNLRRSSPQYENASLQLGWNTTLEQLDQLESKMNNWLSKDEKRMFAPSTSVVIQSFNYMRYIEVTMPMGHRANWQDWGERWNRRTAFHAALLHYCKELDISFVNSTQPIEYWQEDLDQAPIQDDNTNDLDDLRSPLSPLDGENQIPIPAPLQPVMGFLPPEGSTMRRRKGHSKSKNMASSGL